MAITRQDVLHVAKLAKLELLPEEVEPLMQDLDRILQYVELLGELDTEGVPPTAHVAVEAAPFRQDEHREGLSAEQALAEAPRAADGRFAVPAFVEED